MMELFADYSNYTLLFSNAVLLCGAALALLRFERRVRTNREFWDSPTGVAVTATEKSETGSTDAVLSGFLERQLAIIDQHLNSIDARLSESASVRPVDPRVDLSFAHAARMARNGASAEDLVRTCGLTRAEAGLVLRLHVPVSSVADAG